MHDTLQKILCILCIKLTKCNQHLYGVWWPLAQLTPWPLTKLPQSQHFDYISEHSYKGALSEAFCLAPGGFGLAPPVELTVFQPFFLELNLPYSITCGEHFGLKATVFNYLSKCIMVSVTPAHSLDYTLTPLKDVQYSSCLCANGRKTFSWTMAPSILGVLNVSIIAEAVQSHSVCDNEIVNVLERGHIECSL
nr:alpha-2-macroglobulin isoform X2 [Salvelinus alpinus]